MVNIKKLLVMLLAIGAISINISFAADAADDSSASVSDLAKVADDNIL